MNIFLVHLIVRYFYIYMIIFCKIYIFIGVDNIFNNC